MFVLKCVCELSGVDFMDGEMEEAELNGGLCTQLDNGMAMGMVAAET